MHEPVVLIVESDIVVRAPLAGYLRDCGYRVIEAVDAGEARQFLSGTEHRIDIVLADVDASGENGFALAAWLKAKHPQVQVVLAGTAQRAAEKAGDLCDEGPALRKPYDHRLVLEQIKRYIAARDRG